MPLILLALILGAGLWVSAGALGSLFAAWGEAWVVSAEGSSDRAARLDAGQWRFLWATSLDPLSPDHRQGYGRVLEMRGAALPPGSREGRELLDQALAHYDTAARARPAWPFTWLAIARVMARRGTLNADFDAAYRRGCDLGHWDPKVQTLALDLGLTLWGLLSHEAREAAQGVLERSLAMQPRAAVFKAVRAGRADLVAPLVAGDAALEKLLKDAVRAQPGAVLPGPRT